MDAKLYGRKRSYGFLCSLAGEPLVLPGKSERGRGRENGKCTLARGLTYGGVKTRLASCVKLYVLLSGKALSGCLSEGQ